MFRLFVLWVYSTPTVLTPGVPNSHNIDTLMNLVKLWVFAGEFDIALLQNDIISSLLDLVEQFSMVPTHYLAFVWSNTVAGSPLRSLMTDLVVLRMDRETFRTHRQLFPTQILLDFVIRSPLPTFKPINFDRLRKKYLVPANDS